MSDSAQTPHQILGLKLDSSAIAVDSTFAWQHGLVIFYERRLNVGSDVVKPTEFVGCNFEHY